MYPGAFLLFVERGIESGTAAAAVPFLKNANLAR